MSKGVIRPLKTGGYSLCTSPDNLVGKGRCKHILAESLKFDGDNDDTRFISIGDNKVEDEEEVNKYIANIGSDLSDDKRKRILSKLKEI